jgi:uncharacterized protein
MIHVEIVNTFLINKGKEFVILLRGTGSDTRTLPISIGQLEAQSIALQLNHIPFPRPLTHDLLKEIIINVEGTIVRTEIYELKEETFFASLILQIGEKTLTLEARPSDAIAMALRFDAPVFVDETVMDQAGVIIPEPTEETQNEIHGNSENEEKTTVLTTVDELRRQLEKAIALERYEEAARLRDEIIKQTKSN